MGSLKFCNFSTSISCTTVSLFQSRFLGNSIYFGFGPRESRGREVYGRREKIGRKTGFVRRGEPGEVRKKSQQCVIYGHYGRDSRHGKRKVQPTVYRTETWNLNSILNKWWQCRWMFAIMISTLQLPPRLLLFFFWVCVYFEPFSPTWGDTCSSDNLMVCPPIIKAFSGCSKLRLANMNCYSC